MDDFVLLLGVAILVYASGQAIVSIIRAAKTPAKKARELTSQLETLEVELADARERIEVLERLATDGREQLNRKIEAL